MSTAREDFSKLGFAKSFVLPALLVFLLPAISLAVFSHARARYDAEMRESILRQIQSDPTMSVQERAEAIDFFRAVPFSRLLRNQEFAALVDSDVRFHFATFRWMILLSVISIVAGVLVFLLAAVCVLLSLRSQRAQYVGLSVGWHVLRIFSAFQVVAQGAMLVALSFWGTVLWFNAYVVQLIVVAAILALAAVSLVIAAIFKRPKSEFDVEGKMVDEERAKPLWEDLRKICAQIGTELPDQIIVGIDDNFFVTEHPVTVDGQTHGGRTLYLSLSLLKQLNGSEAAAVLAHEMAHFSGQDTTYSKKISPLLVRYDDYLQALHDGGITKPIFYFMLCFRGFFQLSLGTLSRQREFRADRIAMETTSPRAMAGSLLRIAAYSTYRRSIEERLFQQEQTLETADISEQLERGFPEYAVSFASSDDFGDVSTSHPFDSHPPLVERLGAVGVTVAVEVAQSLLAGDRDGQWFYRIANAGEMEREQWKDYEERFCRFHKEALAYRYLPANDEELAIVVEFFPEQTYQGKQGPLVIDFEKMRYCKWPDSVLFEEITNLTLIEGVLQINSGRNGKKTRNVPMRKFGKAQQEVLDAINRYFGRYMAARAYQESKGADAESEGR